VSLDDATFAAMLAHAALARAGLQPEPVAGLTHEWQPVRTPRPGGGEAIDVAPSGERLVAAARAAGERSPNYRIAGNDNAVITTQALPPPWRPLAPNLHVAELAPPPTPPPSTLDEIAGALMRYEASRPRTVQTTLGPSELGTPCSRQIAMKLAGVQRHERGLPWAPMCGTAVHSLMEDVLTRENERLGRQRWVIEETVHLDDELTGHGDAYDTDHALVIDWKYTGTTARRKAARKSIPNDQLVSAEYRVQAHLYGLGHENAGRPVTHVRLVMLARSHDYGESVEWTEAYRPDIAIDAMTRFYAIRDRVINNDMATHPERLADIEATPGEACKWCPFRRLPVPGGPDVDATGCVGDLADAGSIAAFLR
jgi:hypothetical protein